jgi:hypothetical protein
VIDYQAIDGLFNHLIGPGSEGDHFERVVRLVREVIYAQTSNALEHGLA